MEYMLILAAAPESWADNIPADADEVIDDWELYTRALHDAGVLISGHGLHGNDDDATTVQGSRRRTRPDRWSLH